MTVRPVASERVDKRCECGRDLDPFWPFCPSCARRQTWSDALGITGRNCPRCGWMISHEHTFCPWCRAEVALLGRATPPKDAAPGFRMDAPCDWSCGGGVQYPMPYCPWCGREQDWPNEYEGVCATCSKGVDDSMDICPWCAGDATGATRIRPALAQVERLLAIAEIDPWGYRVLLRPGVSGVDPAYPTIVEIDRSHIGRKPEPQIEWSRIVGLIIHELGHSFLYHHWEWARSEAFHHTFGNVDLPYHVPDDIPVDFRHRRLALQPPDHVSAYARLHPQEDFAETFRFYVTRGARLDELLFECEEKHKTTPVFSKFLLLHDYLRSIRRRVSPSRPAPA
ncbi:MAG: putative zinc-binding metallopeptidase [Gemmatimonadales bacterium]